MNVTFYNNNEIPGEQIKFAVIAARCCGKWIFCRHKTRATWEIPGGHREAGENILNTAKRELFEETGAIDFDIKHICVYGVEGDGKITYGALYFAEVKKLGELPAEFEIGEIGLFESLPDKLTYPEIQPELFKKVNAEK